MATRTSKQTPSGPPATRARSRVRAPRASGKAPARRDERSAIEVLRGDVLNLKRERILREAASLFYERGYMQTTMDAIAERMGATKPFVYYHFESKVEMLVEICERATADALAAAEKALSTDTSASARFEAFVRAFTRVALANHQFVAIYFREESSLPDDARARINAMRKTISQRLKDLLADGAASGEFEIDDPGMTALVVAGMSSYAFAWYRDQGRLDLETVTEHIVRMAMKVVGSRSAPQTVPRA